MAGSPQLGLVRRRPAFARLAAAELVSPLGDAMGTLALILHIQRTNGTATAAALVLVAESIPPLLAPVLGAVADRADRRRLVVACEAGQALAVGAIAVLLPPLGVIAALVLVRAALATVFAAAAGAAVPEVVDDAELAQANAVVATARELGTIAGPVAAGALFAAWGARPALAFDAATFLVTIPLLAALPPRGATLVDESLFTSTRAGIAALFRTRTVTALAVGFWVVVLASAGDDLVLPFLGRDALGAGPLGIGVLAAGASAGLVAGLAALGVRPRNATVGGAVAGFAVVGGANLATGLAPALAIAVALQVVRGLGIALVEANVRTLVQRAVPRELLGRVLANLYGGIGVAAAVSYAIGGVLTDATSPRVAMVVGGAGAIAGAAVTATLAFRQKSSP